MSVNSKMTAIANKIRTLLGITGTMGLDAMATNLGTEQTNVANAFTAVGNKGGTVPSSKVSGNLASAINSIPTGVDTSDATATANDMAEGVTAYVDGEKVTGSLPVDKDGGVVSGNIDYSYPPLGAFVLYWELPIRGILDIGATIGISCPMNEFGDATAEDVVAGKKFTSESGLTVEGSLPVSAELIGEGQIITDNVSDGLFVLGLTSPVRGVIENGASVQLACAMAEFGDATAADVISGKTFTSANGVKLTGTGSAGVDVKIQTGSYTTNSSGSATVNCGFKPDAVLLTASGNSGTSYGGVGFTGFNKTSGGVLLVGSTTSYAYAYHTLTQSSNGFSVSATRYSTSFQSSNESNRTVNYVAIKYTE